METLLNLKKQANSSKKLNINVKNVVKDHMSTRRLPKNFLSPYFSNQKTHPLDEVRYRQTTSVIRDVDGGTVFEMKDIEVPESWSQLATDILVSKYFRKSGVPGTQHEVSVKQVVKRIAKTIEKKAVEYGYLEASSADVFERELSFLLIHQYAAFNSPVWFNLGLFDEYGITGSGGSFAYDFLKGQIYETANAFERPQCSACFIQSVDDDLMSIFDLIKNEAKLFKYGSGTGTNFSKLRGKQERLSGGGTSSGVMSFLEVLDRGAAATKSGGTTRRAAKMVTLDVDHPEIMDFIEWKMKEEKKVKALIDGGYSADFNGEAYKTVSGQNSNNSVRVSDAFMQAVINDQPWSLIARTTGEALQTVPAREIWEKIAASAWACADPGLQFETTINQWHTCLNTDRIYASNPCSEYLFLDNSACNLSSLNLVRFLDDSGNFKTEAFQQAVKVMILAQEILVGHSSYPTALIAKNSNDFRPLGLGFANLGTLLMMKGIPYDSDEGRHFAASVTSLMSGVAYRVSSDIAKTIGAFPRYAENESSMLKVMSQHLKASEDLLNKKPDFELAQVAHESWKKALQQGEISGFRNAQISVLAPTGTIGLLMDCDTTGVEPDFALVKFKKLSGGGYFKIVNQSVPAALKALGYSAKQIQEMIHYAIGRFEITENTPVLHLKFLKEKGYTESEIQKIQERLPSVFHLEQAFQGFPNKIFSDLGLTEKEVDEASLYFCGTQTLEGAPHLKSEHLPVFDCANRCGEIGTRFIAPMGHLKMMAAVQPFLSGAISKTVNLPHEVTKADIESLYLEAWKLGLKAVAIYRDGSKLSQPLNSKREKKSENLTDAGEQSTPAQLPLLALTPARRRLPPKRKGVTIEANVAGHKVYLRTGEYEEGALGEIFIDMHKEGAAFRSMMNCFAISVSLGLQYGVPLEEFVNKFTFTRFEPSGTVSGHPNIKMATSIVDYIFRVLGMEYLGRTDFLQVKPSLDVARDEKSSTPISTSSSHLAEMMGDAPPCDSCGHTTVRNGSCYRCLNCGNSMGCS